MMKLLKSLNKEQLTAVITVAICLLVLFSGLTSGETDPEWQPPNIQARPYHTPEAKFVELPGGDFKIYWQVRDIFKGELSTSGDLPDAPFPEARIDRMTAPPLEPGPVLSKLNKLGVKHRYFPLESGVPTVDPAQLPASPDISSLAGTAEPEMPAPADHRGNREREWDEVWLKDDTGA